MTLQKVINIARQILLVLGWVLLSKVGFTQSYFDPSQQWIQYYNQTQFNEHFSLMVDGGFRLKNNLSQPSQYIARAGIGRQLGKFKLAVGFAHLGFYNNQNLYQLEWRPYQEAVLKTSLQKVTINQRVRNEQRFYNATHESQTPLSVTFVNRFRYLINLRFNLVHLKNEQSLFLVVGNELFLNFTNQPTLNLLDQNRIQISPSYGFNKNLSVALTYNLQSTSFSTTQQNQHTNIFWVQVKHHLGKR